MRLLEHRAKTIFSEAGIPTPSSERVGDVESAIEAAAELGYPVAVKAQIPVGSRGKAGGIEIVNSESELREAAGRILGMEIEGYTVDTVLIEAAVDATQELYVGITMDRSVKRPVIMVSAQGGVDIETVAENTPDAIAKEYVDPGFGIHPYQTRRVVYDVDIPEEVAGDVADILLTLFSVWEDRDGTDAEINPLMVTESGEVIAADAVLNVDDDALFRQSELTEDESTQSGSEPDRRANEAGFEYVRLSGSVGVIGNGAGLVMTTLDLIDHYGGTPANFLDVGGGADANRVGTALDVLFEDENVEVVLVNIFGGITRGDEVASGINRALARYERLPVPVVVRLSGTNAKEGRETLTDAVVTEGTFEAAVHRAVDLAGGGSQ